jgi:hypothetical protein
MPHLAVQRGARPLLQVGGRHVGAERDASLQAVRAALRQRSGENAPIEPADIARVLGIARAKVAATAWP